MKQFLVFCSFLLFTFLLTSCTENQIDPGSDQVITILGEVELNVFGPGVNNDDLTVQSAKLTSAGDIIPLSDVTANVDSEGLYEINFDEREALIEAVVVSHDDQQYVGYIPANVENGNIYYLEPIGTKSTVNTHIFRETLKASNSNTVRKSDITNILRLVDSESLIDQGTLRQSLANGILNYANARTAYSESSGSNVGDFDLLLAHELMDQAQMRLQQDLVVSTSDTDIASAYRVFYDRILDSIKNEDTDRVNVARIANIQRTLLANSFHNISKAEVKDQVNQSTAYFVALALVDSIEETLEQSRISDLVQNQISQSGNQLLELLYNPEVNEEELAMIFNQFSDDVISYFKSDPLVDGEALDVIISSINASEGPRAQFISGTESGTSALTFIGVHDNFFEAISETISESSDYGDVNRDVLADFLYLTHI